MGGKTGAPGQSSGRPTLRTISGLTGLAVTTVSRALNDAPDIGEATKERVRRVAAEIGYRPNRAGVRLRTGRTNVIALVLYTFEDVMSFTSHLVYAISAGLENTPYHLIIRPYSRIHDPMDPVRYVVETGSADGIVLNRVMPDDPRVKYLLERDFPFVTHGRTFSGWEHPYFDFDNYEFGAESIRELARRGRRNIALLLPPADQSYGRSMREGAIDAGEETGVNLRFIETATSEADFPTLNSALSGCFAGPDRPDGLLTGSASAAMAAIALLEAQGLEVGKDVAVATKDTSGFLREYRKDVIVFRENIRRAGGYIAEAIVRRIDQPELPPMQELDRPGAPEMP